jgi:hypothetical protein
MIEAHIVPIRGKPRTLERTIMNNGFVSVGREGRAMGFRRIFQNFILLDLSVPSEETRVLGVMTTSLHDQLLVHASGDVFLMYILNRIYNLNRCAFLLLSLTTKFFTPAIHLFTAFGLSNGSTGNTSNDGSTGREGGVIGTELSSSVVDNSLVNAGVFWRGFANVFRCSLPGNGVGGVENR